MGNSITLNKGCILYEGKKKDCPVTQKGKTYRLLNNSGYAIEVYEVDPCLIPSVQHKKCDNLFIVKEDKKNLVKVFFVELKGSGITDAIKQIDNSINILENQINANMVYGRIVGKRVTPDIKSRRAKLDEKLKQLGGDLKIASTIELIERV